MGQHRYDRTNSEKKRRRGFPYYLVIVLLMVAFARSANQYISVSNSVSGRELPIYSVKTDKKQVALSFDAAWGNEDTQKILDILKKHDVKVTFFMTGGWVDQFPSDVKAIAAAGHDLGNHSLNHKHMSQLSDEENKEEILQVHSKVVGLTDIEMTLFRPPYGDYDDDLIRAITDIKYYPIQWSVDSLDWKDYGADNIVDTILNHKALQPGAIILMHNGAKYTAEALEQVITGLKEKGYELVPISKLIYRKDYHMDADGSQIKNGVSH